MTDTHTITKGSSPWQDAAVRLKRNHAAVASIVVLLIIIGTCVFLPISTTLVQDPNLQELSNKNASPSGEHWFGTDHLGRDIFSRVLYGGRISILVGLVTTMVSVTLGVIWGAIAGFSGGRTDDVMMRTVDVLYALPFLVIVILLGKLIGEHTSALTDEVVSWFANSETSMEKQLAVRTRIEPITTLVPLFVAIGALSWLTVSRIVRAQVQSIAKLEFVEAARSLGLSKVKILFRHILPNAIGPIIVYTTLTIPGVMLFEATLSFLNLGVKPPNSSWGVLIKEGADRMSANFPLLFFPSLFFAATLFALNFLGDGLRDALDPKSSKD